MLSKFRELIWPILDVGTDDEIRDREQADDKVIDVIGKARWQHNDVILDEARTLALRDDERRKTTDTKATICLAVLAAIVPLSLSFVKDLSDYLDTLLGWQVILLAVLFLIAIVYLLAAGVWTFRTIAVSTHHRVDVDDLVRLSETAETDVELSREILKAVRKNRNVANNKVSKLLMSHEFLLRMFVVFIALVVFLGAITVYNHLYEHCEFVENTAKHGPHR